jgi:hypothetical protein
MRNLTPNLPGVAATYDWIDAHVASPAESSRGVSALAGMVVHVTRRPEVTERAISRLP